MYPPSRARRIFKWTFTAGAFVSTICYLLSGWWEINYIPADNWNGPMASLSGGMFYYADWETPASFRNVFPPYMHSQAQFLDAGLSLKKTQWYRSDITFPEFHPQLRVGPRFRVNGVPNVRTQFNIPLWPVPLVLGLLAFTLWRRDRRPPRGFCDYCGYDLTGNTSGVCSECGAKIAISAPLVA